MHSPADTSTSKRPKKRRALPADPTTLISWPNNDAAAPPYSRDGLLFTVTASDADLANGPKQTSFYKRPDGKVDWYELLPTDSSTTKHWFSFLGKKLAYLFDMDPHPEAQDWRITAFPTGYQLFKHHSRPATGGAQARTDVYLYGSRMFEHTNIKFRSPAEFAPHLHWLAAQPKSTCVCKYCTGSSAQKPISESVLGAQPAQRSPSLLHKRPSDAKPRLEMKPSRSPAPSSSPRQQDDTVEPPSHKRPASSSSSSPVKKRRISSKPTSTKRAIIKPPIGPPYLAFPRTVDLRSSQPYRRGELVWVALPTVGGIAMKEADYDPLLSFWPAIAGEQQYDIQDGVRLPLWEIKLLACDNTLRLSTNKILPWLAFEPQAVLFPLSPLAIKPAIWNPDDSSAVRPDLTIMRDFPSRQVTLALAIQIAAHIVHAYCGIDQYETEHGVFYQGINFGAETIWTGDLVRLRCTASHLASKIEQLKIKIQYDAEAPLFLKLSAIESLNGSVRIKGAPFVLEKKHKGSHLAELDALSQTDGSDEEEESVVARNLVKQHMPDAPPSMYFRRLLPSAHEVVWDIDWLAGRYYSPDELSIGLAFLDDLNDKPKELVLWRANCVTGQDNGHVPPFDLQAVPNFLPALSSI